MNYTLNHLKEAMDKNHATRQNFLKTLLTIASSMLAILAAFHTSVNTSTDKTTIQVFLFLLTLGSLTLGILAGGIVLYFDTVAAKSIYLQTKDNVLLQLNDSDAIASVVSYDPPKLFYICEKICYITLLFSVISIALFAGLRG